MELKNIYNDILFGVAVGDALGVPVEFNSRQSIALNPVTDMRGHGTHNQPAGTWSDDSSLTFCLAEALIEEFDLQTIGNNLIAWLKKDFWTAHGNVFDIGVATSYAINRLQGGIQPDLAGGITENDNGNGSLMRILPLVVYIKDKPISDRFQITKQVSSITHGHIRSVIACFYYLEFARQLVEGKEKFLVYKNLQVEIPKFLGSIAIEPTEIKSFQRLLDENIYELKEDSISSSGYVLDTLEASIWCVLTTNSFKEATLKAVNLGSDTDTTGAVTGGLAGLLYGYDNIPINWIDQLARHDDIEDLANRLGKKIYDEKIEYQQRELKLSPFSTGWSEPYGFKDGNGRIIIPSIYDQVQEFYRGRAGVCKNDKWGFIDSNGDEIISLIYDDYSNPYYCTTRQDMYTYQYNYSFIKDVALVYFNDKWGIIGLNGEVLIPCIYDNLGIFDDKTEGDKNERLYFYATYEGKNGVIDIEGKEIIPITYDDEFFFGNVIRGSNEYAAVKLNGKWGIINMDGKLVLSCKYDNKPVFDYHSDGQYIYWYTGNDLGFIECDGKIGVIDRAFREVICCKYDKINMFCEGLAVVKMNEKYGYINESGEELTECKYDSADNFSEGLAFIKLNGESCCIDQSGKIVFKCNSADRIKQFEESRSIICKGRKYGFIDKQGNEITEIQYDEVENFKNGTAKVMTRDSTGVRWGMIDKYGRQIVECKYFEIIDFCKEGLAGVMYKGKWGAIDNRGNEIIPCTCDTLDTLPNYYNEFGDFDGCSLFFTADCLKGIILGKEVFFDKNGNFKS